VIKKLQTKIKDLNDQLKEAKSTTKKNPLQATKQLAKNEESK